MFLRTFLESLCLLRMIEVVARLTAHKPKISTENAGLTFSADFFARNLAVNIYMGIR